MNLEWVFSETVEVTETTADVYRVKRSNGEESVELTFGRGSDGRVTDLLVNGEYRDLGDDFIMFVSLIDEYHECGGETGLTVTLTPEV